MPYCPKCDMEFVEGVTVCSDCGGPLYESEEAWKAARKQEKKWEEPADEEPDLTEPVIPERCSRQAFPAPGVYVKKSQQYEDRKSSASAFLLMGCASLAAAVLCIAGILPVIGSAKIIFSIVLTIMGLASLAVFQKTKKEAALIQKEAEEENAATENLITWFLSSHSAEEIDQELAAEAAEVGDDLSAYAAEELSLKRYGLIQDYLITEKDLPDQAYVDLLCEEIYNRMFGQE